MKSIYLVFAFAIFLYFTILLLIRGITTLPIEGDSVNLHIPIANSIISGKIIHPNINTDIFYPAATELILATFILLNIPLNFFNVIGLFLIFIFSFVLGKNAGLKNYMSLWFALSIFLLNGFSRWSLTQKPDILMLLFLIFILIFCFKKKLNNLDYLLLGSASGFFIGSKFTGIVILFLIFIFFYKHFLNKINLKKTIYFLVPFILFGVSWYLRNYLITGSPIYFQGYSATGESANSGLLAWPAWESIINFPKIMINAFISEFMLWGFAFFIVPIFVYFKRYDKSISEIKKLVLISILFLIVYLFLPASDNLTQMIGSMRYIFPSVYLIIFSSFLIAEKYNLNNLVVLISFSNIILLILPSYHPKLVFPILLILIIIEILEVKRLKTIQARKL